MLAGMSDANDHGRITTTPPSPGPSEAAVLAAVALRLLPLLFLLYVVNILDRVNVSFARFRMLTDVGLTGDHGEEVYGLGAGIFYIGYLIFEVPSNLILHRTGARLWIGRIAVSWGLISAAMLFVQGEWSFYALRFLLGVAEAGFFPGIILYLSYWFPARERAKAVARFMIASPIAGALGSPLSGAILKYLDGASGLAGWQWLFLVEGIPSVVLGIVAWLWLTDRPERATWLSPDARAWLVNRMAKESRLRAVRYGLTHWSALGDRRVALLVLLYFTVAVASNTFGFYAPKIVKDSYPAWDELTIGLVLMAPNLAAAVMMVLVAAHSDRTGERRWHVAISALFSASGWALAALAPAPWLVLAGLTFAQVGAMCMLPTFWALPTALLSGTAAAAGIALINSIANLGGFLGPNLIARLKTDGMYAVAGILVAGSVLALAAKHDPSIEKE